MTTFSDAAIAKLLGLKEFPTIVPEQELKLTAETVPLMFLIYAFPKAGKTTLLAHLADSLGIDQKEVLLVDTEGGTSYQSNIRVHHADNFARYHALMKGISRPEYEPDFKYLAIDTMTLVDSFSETFGTLIYMTTPQGKNFNRDAKGKEFPPDHSEFKSVHELGQGYGYAWSRRAFLLWLDMLYSLTKKGIRIILISHIKDKFDSSQEVVKEKEIDLTGKLKRIVSQRVDCIAFFFRKGNKGYFGFDPDNVLNPSGSRLSHLSGQILISEQDEKTGEVKCYWDKIYPQS